MSKGVANGGALTLGVVAVLALAGRVQAGSRSRSPAYLWHGTSRFSLPAIIRHGLRAPSWWGTESMATYFADVTAEDVAMDHQVSWEEAEPILLRVPLDRFDARHLDIDRAMIAEPIESVLEQASETLIARWATVAGTWQDALAVYESVVYRRAMPITMDDVVPVSRHHR